MKPKSRQSAAPGSGLRARRRHGRTRRARAVAVGRKAHLGGRAREESRRQHADDDRSDNSDRGGGRRKSHQGDREHPQRREDQPREARAVIGGAERDRPRAHEPGRDHRIDRDAAHGGPAGAAHERRDEQLPRRDRDRPAIDAGRQEDRRDDGDSGNAEAAVERRHIGDDKRAGEEVDRHGGGDDPEREAARLAHRMQVDRRAIEAEAPAEERQHEGGADDPPAIEPCHVAALEPAPLCAPFRARRYGARRSIGLAAGGGPDLAKIARSADAHRLQPTLTFSQNPTRSVTACMAGCGRS